MASPSNTPFRRAVTSCYHWCNLQVLCQAGPRGCLSRLHRGRQRAGRVIRAARLAVERGVTSYGSAPYRGAVPDDRGQAHCTVTTIDGWDGCTRSLDTATRPPGDSDPEQSNSLGPHRLKDTLAFSRESAARRCRAPRRRRPGGAAGPSVPRLRTSGSLRRRPRHRSQRSKESRSASDRR